MEEFILGSAKDNSALLISAVISVGIIKSCDFAGRNAGNFLRNRVESKFMRYLLYFLLCLGILIGSKMYYTRSFDPNLFRKYHLTRFSPPEKIRELYRSLARQSHPDMKGDGQAFVRMNSEIKTLMNDRQRWFYDRFGRLSDGSSSDEQSEQVGFAIQVFIQYLQKAMFVIVFVQNDLNLNTRMSALALVLGFLLFDLYNITARRSTSKDPLDFIYYDFTLKERSSIMLGMFEIFFFLMITFKFAFEEPWVLSWMKWISHVEILQLAIYRKTTGEIQKEYLLQNKEIVADKFDVVESLDLRVNKRPPKPQDDQNTPAPHVENNLRPSEADGTQRKTADQTNDVHKAQLFGNKDDSLAPPADEQPAEPQEIADPREASLWSLLVNLLKGIATFYAINMAIQLLFKL